MKKKLLTPLIVFIISLVIGAYQLFFRSSVPFYDPLEENEVFIEYDIEQLIQQKAKLLLQIPQLDSIATKLSDNYNSTQQTELIEQTENILQLINESRTEIEYLNEEIASLQRVQTTNGEEKELKQKSRILGIITVLIVSLILAVSAFFIQRLLKNKKISVKDKPFIIIFILFVLIMLYYIEDNQDEEAISFAIIAGSALISHSHSSKRKQE